MKVSASKKTITILSICFVFLLLIGVLLLYKDIIRNGIKYGAWFTVDKYEELLEDCEWEKKENNLIFKCKALLLFVTEPQKDEEICYILYLIPRNEGDFIEYNLCDNTTKIQLQNPYKTLEPGKLLPVSLTISNNRENLGHYTYEKIVMVGISKEEEFREWYKIKNMELISEKLGRYFKLMGSYPMKANYDGIELVNYNNYFGEVRLYNVVIKNISAQEGYIYLDLEGYINGMEKSYNISLRTKSFSVETMEGNNYLHITPLNLEEMPKWNRYALNLIYTTHSTQENFEKLCGYDVEGLYKEVCARKEELDSTRYSNILNTQNDFEMLVNKLNKDSSADIGMILLNISRVF